MQVCSDTTGKAPIEVQWVGTDKGTSEASHIRCRLVGRDFRGGKVRVTFYASMPPLEAKKARFDMMSADFDKWRRGSAHKFWKLMFIDVKQAPLEVPCDNDDASAALPDQDAKEASAGGDRQDAGQAGAYQASGQVPLLGLPRRPICNQRGSWETHRGRLAPHEEDVSAL